MQKNKPLDILKLTIEEKNNLLDAYNQALVIICDVGCDYDGSNTIKDLKMTMDVLVDIARDGLRGNRPQYIQNGKVIEIVHHKIVEVPEDRWNESMKNHPWLKKNNDRNS